MKDGKAAGPDGVSAEMIKYEPEVLFELLAHVFTLFLGENELPFEQTTSYMSKIYKKGDRNECSNDRRISVTTTLSRIYGKVIKNVQCENLKMLKNKVGSGQARPARTAFLPKTVAPS